MQPKNLAYLEITIKEKGTNKKFCELYTFLKETSLYLPFDLLLNVGKMDKEKIFLCLMSTSEAQVQEEMILSMCGPCSIKLPVCVNHKFYSVFIKLCQINYLKPCCRLGSERETCEEDDWNC